MTITMNTAGGDVLLTFSGNIYASGNENAHAELQFSVDGSARHNMRSEAGDGGWENDFSMQWIEKGLNAGSHTFKVRWKDDNTNNVQQLGLSYPRAFSAIELGGSSGVLNCTTKTQSGTGNQQVYCDAGWTMTSGGCNDPTGYRDNGPQWDRPVGNGWECLRYYGGSVDVYVRCCKF